MNRKIVEVGDEGIVLEVEIEVNDEIKAFYFMVDTGAAA